MEGNYLARTAVVDAPTLPEALAFFALIEIINEKKGLE